MMHPFPFRSSFIEPNDSMGFSRFDLDYWKNPEIFSKLITDTPTIHAVHQQINAKSHYSYRIEISNILRKQYKDFPENSKVFDQITKLEQSNTFTVICAHQPFLFGGPLFWAYKILSTIQLCNQLAQQFLDLHFIPIYFSGNEDHDFEEIRTLQLFQKTIRWDEQHGKATGRLPVGGLTAVVSELESLFQRNEVALNFLKKNQNWLANSNNYCEYFRHFVNDLFGESGLIYFNPDDLDAKKLFTPIIEKELKEQFIYTNTLETNNNIQQLNYPLQVNPRELNLFYHHDAGRKRIIRQKENYQILDTEISWTSAETMEDLKRNPLSFSPNVLMRPLYQEFLFPNLAFVGGGGEIAYWMQLKKCFEAASIPYPILFRRLSAFCYDQSILAKVTKSPLSAETFLQPLHELEKAFIKLQTNADDLIEKDIVAIEQLLDKIKKNSDNLDASTKSSIESELQKINKSLEHISSKRDKALKHKYELDIQNIRKIKESLFPANSIQERAQSFLPYYFKHGNDFFNLIQNAYDPQIARVGLFMEQ